MSSQIEVMISPVEWTEEDFVPTCNVLLLYEDLAHGKQAMELCRQLNKRVGDEVALRFQMWRFDVLALSLTKAAAAANAAKADVIVFAARAGLELKAEFKHWMEREWRPRADGQECAFVALLDSSDEAVATKSEGLHDFLRKTAAQLGIPFFSLTGGPVLFDHLSAPLPPTRLGLSEAPISGLEPMRRQAEVVGG